MKWKNDNERIIEAKLDAPIIKFRTSFVNVNQTFSIKCAF